MNLNTMHTILSGNARRRIFNHLCQTLILSVLFLALNVCADPRAPLPPTPEASALWHESFDEYYFTGDTNSQLVISGFGFLVESWSGYALERIGSTVVPFTIPALDSTGQTNVSSDAGGTLRFWFQPARSSQSQAGTGPETNAVLMEFDAASGGETALAWSLAVSSDGNTLALLAQTDSGIEPVIQSQIGWQTNESHCLVLEFSSSGSVLYVDGQPVGQGAGLPSVPPSLGQLTIGSTISGTNAAEGDLEEIYSFNYWPSNADVAAYYGMTYQYAAQGPVSLVGGGGFQLGGGFGMSTIHTPGNVYDPDHDTNCSPGGPF